MMSVWEHCRGGVGGSVRLLIDCVIVFANDVYVHQQDGYRGKGIREGCVEDWRRTRQPRIERERGR